MKETSRPGEWDKLRDKVSEPRQHRSCTDLYLYLLDSPFVADLDQRPYNRETMHSALNL